MDLISLIIIFSIIAKIFKKNSPDKYEDVKRKAKDLGSEVYGELRGNVNARRSDYEKRIKDFEQSARRNRSEQRKPVYEQMNMQDYQNAQAVSNKQKQKPVMEENDEARMQVYKSRMEAKNTTILQRAKANAEEDREDETLRSLEELHGHSAHVAPAIHHHPEDVLSDNMLGTVEDLMVKGYDGNLCFERDFVGEAMDMISRFTVPTDVPDFSKKEVS